MCSPLSFLTSVVLAISHKQLADPCSSKIHGLSVIEVFPAKGPNLECWGHHLRSSRRRTTRTRLRGYWSQGQGRVKRMSVFADLRPRSQGYAKTRQRKHRSEERAEVARAFVESAEGSAQPRRRMRERPRGARRGRLTRRGLPEVAGPI